MPEQPVFPLAVRFSDGETAVLEDRLDTECNLEWLDSNDPEDPVEVLDAQGRSVHLRIDGLEIQTLELVDPRPRDAISSSRGGGGSTSSPGSLVGGRHRL